MTLNERRDQGRSKIDKFFKKKNYEHTKTYREKIHQEEHTLHLKKDTIQKLAEIEDVLRRRLEQSSQRNSQMDQVIGNLEQSFRERSKSRSNSRVSSRLSLNKTFDNSPKRDPNEPSLITSVEGELLGKKEPEV